MIAQSTNHLFMIEPADFFDNPDTKPTNAYQVRENSTEHASIQQKALAEFRAYRDMLVDHGVMVTTAKGQMGAPDDIFPNWFSTHASGQMVLYPMMYASRQIERRKDLSDDIRRRYNDIIDFSAFEKQGKNLESTSSLIIDHAKKIAYMARSSRSDEGVAKEWARVMGFTLIAFDTEHKGIPVYHSDVVMWLGTKLAGICSECLRTPGIVESLRKSRDVVEFDNEQMNAFCGNALEVVGKGGEKMLVISASAIATLRPDQKDKIGRYYKTIISPKLDTIEKYGGGSARCMLAELF